MAVITIDSNTTAPTLLLQGKHAAYAYRRLGRGIRRPLLCLQHFTGTLDNWDPSVTDPLAVDRLNPRRLDSKPLRRLCDVVPAIGVVSGCGRPVAMFASATAVRISCRGSVPHEDPPEFTDRNGGE